MNVLLDQDHNHLDIKTTKNIFKKNSIIQSPQLIELIVEQSAKAIAILDRQLKYLMVNQKWLEIYSLSLSSVINKHYLAVFNRHCELEKTVYEDCLLEGKHQQIIQTITNHQGITQQIKLSVYPWYGEQNKILGIVVFSQQLPDSFSPIKSFFDHSLDLLCIARFDGYFEQVNPAFQKILGYSESELTNQPFFNFIHAEDISATLTEIEKLKQGIPSINFENRYRCHNGTYRRLQWTVAAPKNEHSWLYATARDITKSYQLQQQLHWESKHDHLTGLINRREFAKKINQIIDSTKNTNQLHAFCYLNLDHFKIINDICGHQAGDELLRKITILIEQQLQKSDLLSRLGGDEFGLLLKNCSVAKAEKIAYGIREVIKDFRFYWQDQNFVLGISIGIVVIDGNSRNFSHLLGTADMACYAAKDRGSNSVRVYYPEDKELVQKQDEKHWISKLNLALEENRFCLYHQKITPLQDNLAIDHYEILLRLFDRAGNLISPIEFIPAAERYDLMPSIDRWVIKNFFASYQHHYQDQKSSFANRAIYTINLSGASISSSQFFQFLKEQFQSYQVAPEKICFEITETSAIANLAEAATFINEIKELGCSFALDDFGSGMSSLNYLKNLPVDYLKIDGNFVKNIVNDPIDRATVECFNRIGEAMNIKTIAEFVENEAIAAQLKQIGVNYAQGYGIEKPIPLSFFENS